MDLNDLYPEFVGASFKFDVSESTAVGTMIGVITAEDGDVTSVLVYTMEGSYADFLINSATGQIFVAKPLGLISERVSFMKKLSNLRT